MLLRSIIISAVLVVTFRASAATHEYTVTLSGDLSELRVDAQLADGRSRTYSVDLEPLDRYSGLSAETIVVSIDDWMRRPRLRGDDEVIVTFQLPDGVAVSVPWQPLDADGLRYRLRSSPRSGSGLAVFGQFDKVVVPVADMEMRIVALPIGGSPIPAEIIDWTRQTAEHITLAYGRFPNPEARVILFPVGPRRSNSAVQFGRVVRDGGETIELLVNPNGTEEAFLGDWTATHEFTHLMHPYITRDQRWITEGLAQYYQNVLLARAGRYTPEEAWRKITEGLERGRESSPSLTPNQAAGGDERNSRMKIYWSGAALALIADIELRRASNGELSLDEALGRLQSCCLPSRRVWQGREFFEQLDALIGESDLFRGLYDKYADSPGFPDFEAYLNSPELAEIRAAITARRYTGESGN